MIRTLRKIAQIFTCEPVIFHAPEIQEGAKCRCGAQASEQWYPSVCALEGKPKEWIALCTECDVRLNEITVRHLYGESREADLAEYRALKTGSLN